MTKEKDITKPVERDPKWEYIQSELSRPFPAKYMSVKPGAVSENGSALLLWFIDARAVMNRLDSVVGPENWSFSWQPVTTLDARVAIHGKLRVLEVVKEDVGEAQDEAEPYKSGVSDAFKRCGVHFGLGRYLYSMPQLWWPYDKQKRRFANLDELEDFTQSIIDKISGSECEACDLNIRELQAQVSSISRGNGDRAGRTERPEQPGSSEATSAQQERIRQLQIQKFGTGQDSRDKYDQFQRSVIGRVCKRSELTKFEADKAIKALMVLPDTQAEAA